MNEINNLLSKWVYSNKRLIIPGLGAFLKNEHDGKVIFSSFLQYNDGLLEQIIASYKSISASEAGKLINDFVIEIKASLSDSGQYNIKDLGYFTYGDKNAIQFVCTEKNLNETNASKPIVKIETQERKLIETQGIESKKSKHILLSSIFLSSLILGTLLFFFLNKSQKEADLIQEEIIPIKTTQNILNKEQDTLKKEIEVRKINSQNDNIGTKVKYHVIGGCFFDKINAEKFVHFCRENGYREAEIIGKIGDLHPVSIIKFDSMPEADKEKEIYNNRYDEDAWVFRSF